MKTFEIFPELPKCEMESWWEKMLLKNDLFDTLLPQNYNLLKNKNEVPEKCNKWISIKQGMHVF